MIRRYQSGEPVELGDTKRYTSAALWSPEETQFLKKYRKDVPLQELVLYLLPWRTLESVKSCIKVRRKRWEKEEAGQAD